MKSILNSLEYNMNYIWTLASRSGLKSMAAAHVLFTFYYDCSLGALIGALYSESYIDKEAMEQKKFGGFWTRFFFILGNVIAVLQRIRVSYEEAFKFS